VGARRGPELSRIGAVRTAAQLATALLDPDSEVQPDNRSYRVTTRGGQRVSGRLLNHDVYTVQLLDSNEQLRSFMKADLAEAGFMPSPMPSLRGKFEDGELADLVQYLVSLRGAGKQ
jgi:putative heme-binding domain-containing protein